MRAIHTIVVHCSATPKSHNIGAKEIREWHLAKGWSDNGYHYVIRRNGKRELGRPITKIGAGVKGHNRGAIHICIVGGVNADDRMKAVFNFTRKTMTGLDILLRHLTHIYKGAKVKGHRDFPGVKKACPCFDVRAWWYNK